MLLSRFVVIIDVVRLEKEENMVYRKKRSRLPVFIVVIAAIAVVCVLFYTTYKKDAGSKEEDPSEYFNITDDSQAAVVIDGVVADYYGTYINGGIYISYETVWNEIDTRFYVEEAADTMYIALPYETYSYAAGDGSGYLYKDSSNEYYISVECIELYTNLDIALYDDPYRIVITTNRDDISYDVVKEECVIRAEASSKARILCTALEGDILELIRYNGEWDYVITNDGYMGYVHMDYVSETDYQREDTYDESLEFTALSTDYTVSMAWDYIGSTDANAYLDAKMEGVSGLNVISPKWFILQDASGNMTSYADAEYVSKANNTYGMAVWALVSGYAGEDMSTAEILSSYDVRRNFISQLVSTAVEYSIEGINIDFEDISEEYAPAYIEFLRELTQAAHQSGIIVSVDNYVPGYTDYYRRDAQNAVVDYIIMMGYDEHTAYSSDIGSVASLTYVEEGIEATLEQVDSEKLILGVPFYTRGWTVPFGADYFETETVYMSEVDEYVSLHEIELTWDSDAGQYTGSSEDDENRYYIWVEDASSLEKKLSLVDEYSLAGACAWRLGMETSDVWGVWTEYLN